MFNKEELQILNEALKMYEEKTTKQLESSANNKDKMVAYNRKQKKIWLLQNKMKKLIEENK
ncbi:MULTISPECIES: hypothetical protein [unclassified Clostridium]|uniref:hypothetical protein n=1 Tax=unclassified Clostridium TaxID=2614128 RepID=UPI001896C001|nr:MULTISPECIES: hypothetical protein [unclassified Clostridium]MCR1950488.1 hypothetical protein [Clostridium sp. DSM 100503]MDU3524831.1 hypothetical protein [Clostridium sp.]MDU6363440.1 hypothetical protein [Clostridium sp.]